jgi:hypothetical protein
MNKVRDFTLSSGVVSMGNEPCDLFECVALYRRGRKEEALENLIGSREVSCGSDTLYETCYRDSGVDRMLHDCLNQFAGLIGTDQVKGIFFNAVCDFFEKNARKEPVQFASGAAALRCLRKAVHGSMFAELERCRRFSKEPVEKYFADEEDPEV